MCQLPAYRFNLFKFSPTALFVLERSLFFGTCPISVRTIQEILLENHNTFSGLRKNGLSHSKEHATNLLLAILLLVMGRTQQEGLENERPGELLGQITLGQTEGQDVGMQGGQNLPDISYDYAFASKNAEVTEKFILDLLSLPEMHNVSAKGASEDNSISMSCENSNFSAKEGLPRSWTPKSGIVQAEKDLIPNEPANLEKLSDSDLNQRDAGLMTIDMHGARGDVKIEGITDHDGSDQVNCTHHNLKGIRGAPIFKEIRTRRRREFHKIHTRRSRAKLNEKMELLRRVLPEPPAGLVVKSKAQIIDYAITVLAKVPLNQLEADCTFAQKE